MLFPYNPDNFTIKRVLIKSVTSAVGGGIRIVDDRPDAKRNGTIRYDLHSSAARAFLKDHPGEYAIPVNGAILMYGESAIAVEMAPINYIRGESDIAEWEPQLVRHLAQLNKEIESSGVTWYFDGTYVFRFRYADSESAAWETAMLLNRAGDFRACEMLRYTLSTLSNNVSYINIGFGLMYSPDEGDTISVSPPIWASVGALNSGGDDEGGLTTFEGVNQKIGVNLNFALNAGVTISKLFGVKHIEPLALPRLMLQYKSINLGALPKEVKAVNPCFMGFAETCAWLMGFMHKANEFEQMWELRRLLAYLMKRGNYMIDRTKNVYLEGMSCDVVPDIVPLEVLQRNVKSGEYEHLRNAVLDGKLTTTLDHLA